MSYSLFVAATADRQLRKLTRAVQARLDPAIDALADDPRPHGSRKMQGTKSSYRILTASVELPRARAASL